MSAATTTDSRSLRPGPASRPKQAAPSKPSKPQAARGVLWPRIVFICATSITVLLGLVMVYSASSVIAMEGQIGLDYAVFQRQLLIVAASVIGAAVLAKLPYRRFHTWNPVVSWIFWLVVVFALIATKLYGDQSLGSQRSVAGISPGEFAKIAMMLVCAHLILEARHEGFSNGWVFKLGVAVGVPVILVAIQPDFMTSVIGLVGVLIMMWMGGMPWRHILLATVILVAFGLLMVLGTDFRSDRIELLLDPWADDPATAAAESDNQATNALLAFGDGGLLGKSLGYSHQKYGYLPFSENDFIFAIIAEELGLVGAVAVVLLFSAIVFSGFFIARNAVDEHGRLVAGTSAMLIGVQAFYNMYMAAGFAPIAGKTLPFISQGGSSIAASMMLAGLILWVSFNSVQPDRYEQRRDNLVIHDGGKAGQGGQGGKRRDSGKGDYSSREAAPVRSYNDDWGSRDSRESERRLRLRQGSGSKTGASGAKAYAAKSAASSRAGGADRLRLGRSSYPSTRLSSGGTGSSYKRKSV